MSGCYKCPYCGQESDVPLNNHNCVFKGGALKEERDRRLGRVEQPRNEREPPTESSSMDSIRKQERDKCLKNLDDVHYS